MSSYEIKLGDCLESLRAMAIRPELVRIAIRKPAMVVAG